MKKGRGGMLFGGLIIRSDENLAKIIGYNDVNAAELTKKVWAYIKKHNLRVD